MIKRKPKVNYFDYLFFLVILAGMTFYACNSAMAIIDRYNLQQELIAKDGRMKQMAVEFHVPKWAGMECTMTRSLLSTYR